DAAGHGDRDSLQGAGRDGAGGLLAPVARARRADCAGDRRARGVAHRALLAARDRLGRRLRARARRRHPPPPPARAAPRSPPPVPPPEGCARSGAIAMSGGGTTLIITSCVCEAVAPATLTVSLPMPSIAVGPALTVTIEVPPAVVAEVGENDATTPVGRPVAV